MHMKTGPRRVAAIAIAGLVLGLPLSLEAAAGEDELAGRIEMVRTLLFESSAARRVDESDSDEARQKRAEAIALYEAALAPGDIEERKARLKQAVDLIYQASAAVPPSASSRDKSLRDFERRRESLTALLDAHERIMAEKGTDDVHTSLLENVETDISAAETLLASGDVDMARERLDRAYDVTRLAVETSREGETLKRELKFETPADEYDYELDRNETHRMLLTVLLKDKMNDQRIRDKVNAFVKTADGHRAAADDMAKSKRYEEAIKELERSTAELVKAIRGAGVYIPG